MFCNLKLETVSLLVLHFSRQFFVFTDRSAIFLHLFVHDCCPFFYWVVCFFGWRTLPPGILKPIRSWQLSRSVYQCCSFFCMCFSFFLDVSLLSLSSEIREVHPPPLLTPHQLLLFLKLQGVEWEADSRERDFMARGHKHQEKGRSKAGSTLTPGDRYSYVFSPH